jgi:hypothetical protein
VRSTATLSGQSQKEFYVNEAHALADALLHAACEGVAINPPASPADGDTWLVGDGANGAWAGKDGRLACYQGGNWLFASANDGMHVFDRSTGQTLLYRGGWQRPASPPTPTGGTTIDAEARTAIGDLVAALAAAGILTTT